ncbi:GTP-binding protein gtr2 [Knufia peltigerae]|uniref:GTP-binding protein gtr2 n=1 Tax=Knufia peltigerae TaxID=1002370 RepID=A0AA39CTF8_9EURO|nr:GTP-binding protein gtr2 [Knufia peltigerae]
MNHTAVENNITQYEHEMEYAHEQEPTVPVVLGEINGDSANLNMSQVDGVFGSALWLNDHLMMGMTMNITRYNLIQGTTFGYVAWVPVPTKGQEPYVRAPLYGQIFDAEAIGHHPNVRIKAAVD